MVCDSEGNDRSRYGEEYEEHPWSGLSFALAHDEEDVGEYAFIQCPIATHVGEFLGRWLYDTREEAELSWGVRVGQ